MGECLRLIDHIFGGQSKDEEGVESRLEEEDAKFVGKIKL